MTTSTPLRLLIIEDDLVDRKLLERLLTGSSLGACEVSNAACLAAGLDRLKEESCDIILLDLGLPDSQGMDSVRRLQARAPHVPIIVLSGLDDEDTAIQAVQMGVQDYLIKGHVDASLLVRAIRYALERKKAERQLQATELRYRTIFENSAVAIMMVDAEERLVSWNTFTERLLGMGPEELRARDIRTLYPDVEWQKIRALSVRRKGMQHHFETRMICGSGEIIDVDISLSVIYDSDGDISGSIGVIRDITERKRMEEALRRSERRFRQVAENAREWIWEVDAEGVYTYASPVVEKILGYRTEEVLGKKHAYDFFHPDDADRLRAESLEIVGRRDAFIEFQTRNLDKSGRVVWLLRSAVPILDENGRLFGYRGADVDITERKNAEESLGHHVAEIERFNRLATARELRVVELKRRINEMACAAGQPAPYAALQEDAGPESLESDEPAESAAVSKGPRDTDYALADLMDLRRMQQLMDGFCDAVGVSAAIVDPQGEVLIQARFLPICAEFHRADPRTLARCVESDTVLAGRLNEGESFSLYRCSNGLTSAGAPIVMDGRHVANMLIGQFLLEPPDVDLFRRQAREFGFDETAYLEALSHVPIMAKDRLPAILRYMTAFAQFLAEVGLERIQGKTHEAELLQRAEELNQANQALRRQREAALSLAEDAHEARATAERVREALLLKDSAVNSAASGIVFIDLEGRCTFVNPSALQMWGYEHAGDVLGRPFTSFLESPDEGQTAYRAAVKTGIWSGELVARRRDGSDLVVQVSASVVKDKNERPICLMVSLIDVTESRRIHEILDRKQKNLEAIFDAAPLGMLLVNGDMTVTRANDTIRHMSGRGYANIIDQGVCRALGCRAAGTPSGDAAPWVCCRLREMIQVTLLSNTPVRGYEIQPMLPGDEAGPRPWLSVSIEPVNIDGRKHVVVALNDITDRKRAEEELKQTMELKAQFISTVSHELRTPMTSMKEAVIIVQDGVAGKLNKDQKHFLDIAKRNIDRLARLIDNVLDFQKLSAGKMKLHLQENDPAAAVNDAYSTMQPHAAASGVHLAVDLEPGLPRATYDNDRILQVLINLISNAIKFTPSGGRVQVSAHRRQEHLIFKISDTGYGIPKEDLSRIFDQFYRVHRPGKEIKGTGLGLAIVHKIVSAHGGRIEAESELEKGTTFTVALPLSPPSGPAASSDQADRDLERVLTQP